MVYCREVVAGCWEGQAGAWPGAMLVQRWNFFLLRGLHCVKGLLSHWMRATQIIEVYLLLKVN